LAWASASGDPRVPILKRVAAGAESIVIAAACESLMPDWQEAANGSLHAPIPAIDFGGSHRQ
jgi:hypothetical protein